ncbi:uncharacterized protein LOC143603892 [Bidens hawaiensis]|uniref:uncharacterized protein LOC143603892 n=1 Tax=Bidens hawaiensis TaxID=980011 RepID=UPI00404A5365
MCKLAKIRETIRINQSSSSSSTIVQYKQINKGGAYSHTIQLLLLFPQIPPILCFKFQTLTPNYNNTTCIHQSINFITQITNPTHTHFIKSTGFVLSCLKRLRLKMAATDVDLEPQLKDVGKQLSQQLDSNDELLLVLDKLEKLLLKVDQSPKKSMLEALRPSINALIRDSLLKHSDMDVKVSVASCISEITRITAPDAPYTDDQMRDVFQLIVSSFEDLADRSSRSFNKRASILETVSKVRSCVIMLDLECDELIVTMFEHFLNSIRDYHLDAIYSSMESIMVLVIEESEEISVELLKPLLASVKKDRVGVLPIAHKLGKDVLLKSAEKLKPYMMPALTALGESLDNYHKVVTAVCEGTAANFDDNDAEQQLADESKATTAASDHVDQVVKAEVSSKEEVDSTVNKSPKSVMSNGVNETVKEPKAEEAPVDQESKKPEEDKNQEPVKQEDTADSDPDKPAKEDVKTENEADTVVNSVEPSDSSHVEGDKEVKKDDGVKESETEKEKDDDVKQEDQNEKDDDVKQEDQNEKDDVKAPEDKNEKDDVKVSENQNEEDKDVKVSENKIEEEKDAKETESEAVESKPAATAQSNNVSDESSVRSEKEPAPQEVKTASPTKSEPTDEGLTQEDKPEDQKQEDTKTVIEKEVKLAETVNKSEDDEASDSDAKPVKRSRSKATKQVGKRSKQSGKKSETPVKKEEKGKIAAEEDEEDDSDDKPLNLSARKSTSKKKDDGKKRASSKSVAEKEQAKLDDMDVSPKIAVEEDDSDDKPLKRTGKRSKQSGKKLETPVKKGEKSKIEDDEDDSDDKPLKQSAKRSTSRKKNDGKQRKDQAKSLTGDDEMDISPKSDKREGKSTETSATSAKRKRSAGKTEASDTIKYDESLVGKKVKVWWPEDKMYYEGVVTEFYPAKKKHKVSYVDGDEEKLNLKTQKWEILKELSVRDDEVRNMLIGV